MSRRGTDFRNYCYTRLWELENEWMDQQIADINRSCEDMEPQVFTPAKVLWIVAFSFVVGFLFAFTVK